MKSHFTEVVDWISTQQEVDKFSKMMDSFVSDIYKRYQEKQNKSSSHTYTSSNIPIEKSGETSWLQWLETIIQKEKKLKAHAKSILTGNEKYQHFIQSYQHCATLIFTILIHLLY